MNSCIGHGCTNILHKPYHQRYRICSEHLLSPSIFVNGSHFRYCQQCSLLHKVSCFNGEQRSCTESLVRIRIRRSAQKQTTASHSRAKRKSQPSDKASRKSGSPDFNNDDANNDDGNYNDNGRAKKNRSPYQHRRNSKQQQKQQVSSPPQYINMEGYHPHEVASVSLNRQLQQQHYGYDPSSHHYHQHQNYIHYHNYDHRQYVPPPVSSRANSIGAIKPLARRGPLPSEIRIPPPGSLAFSIPAATIPRDQQQQHLIYQQPTTHVDHNADGVDANNKNHSNEINADAIENPFANHIKETTSEVWTELPHSRSSLETLRKSRDLSNPLLWTLSSAPMKSLILSAGVTNDDKIK